MAQSPELKALAKDLSKVTALRRIAQYMGQGDEASLRMQEARIKSQMRQLCGVR